MKKVFCLLLLFAVTFSFCNKNRNIDAVKRDIIKYEAKDKNDSYRLKAMLSGMNQEQVFDCDDYVQYLKDGKTPPADLQGRIDTLAMEYGIFK